MKSVTKRRLTRGKGRKTVKRGAVKRGAVKRGAVKRGGAAETKVYPDGTYVGSIDANGNRQSTTLFDGGKMTYNNGDKFEGKWENDKATGLGVMKYANGDDYRGSWVDGKRQGEGKIQYSDRRIYNGNWLQDKKRGQGTMAYPDGGQYQGEWVDDKREGQGTMVYPDGSKYMGQWIDDKRNGPGAIRYKNKDEYHGEWVDDKRKNGYGIMIYINDDEYQGNWVDEKRQGHGVLYDGNGQELFRGNWDNDERNGANINLDVNQIHKFTANIDFDELNAFLHLHSKKENPYIDQPTPDDFGAYIKDSMRKIIQSADNAKIEERLKNFDFLMENTLDKIKYYVYSDDLKTGVFLSLKYAQLQPQAFKEAYVESYLDDTCKAQSNNNDISVANLSCPTGTFERFVTSLAAAATSVLSSGQVNEEQKQEYEKIVEMITRNLKTLIQKLIEEWQYSHRKGVGLESIVGDEQRRANLKEHIEETVRNNTPEVNALIEELIKEYADSIGYDDDQFPQGGAKTRKRRRGKMGKTKKRKLKGRK